MSRAWARSLLVLGALGAVAALLARGTVELLVGPLVSPPRAWPGVAPAAAPDRAADGESILASALFGPLDDESAGAAVDPAPTVPLGCEGLRLVASVVRRDHPESSIATIATGSGSQLVTIGGALDSRRVSRIDGERVTLTSDAGDCELRLFEVDAIGALEAPHVESEPPALGRLAPEPTLDELAEREITETASGFSVGRELVTAIERAGPALLGSLRGVPRPEGLALFGIRRTSLPFRLGLRNGDLLRSIDGIGLADGGLAALAALATLRSAESHALVLERRGEPVTIRYEVR